MARRTSKTTSQPTPATISPERAIELIKRQQDKGMQMLSAHPINEDDFNAWNSTTYDFLVKAFGDASPNVKGFTNARYSGVILRGATEEWWEKRRAENLGRQLKVLQSCIEILETEIELSGEGSSTAPIEQPDRDEIFIVHGHNEGIRETVARFIEKLGLTATVLHERPNEGQTVIEKFEKHSAHAGFAIVLLTGDDRGGRRDEPYENQRPRARQNVILELGFFLAKLGRKHVCALYEQGVEIPSDYQGVLFAQLDDNGRWKVELAREMKYAGLPVDMNKAF